MSAHWLRALPFLTLLLVACGVTAAPAPTATVPPPTPTPEWHQEGWRLVWQDEFEGDAVDPEKWSYEVNGRGGGNNELQYYTDRPENAWVEDGSLVIQADAERYLGRNYTSARLRTLGKGDWRYGRFEIRARLPSGQGIWPAIWMLPTDYEYGGWAASGEIDIVELLGQDPNIIYGTLHYGGQWPKNVHSGEPFVLPEGDFTEAFHVFALEWEPEEIRWYLDGEQIQSQSRWHSSGGPYPAPFDQRFHLLLNVAVGGDWPGPPDESTRFPQQMVVDYVRVYEREGE